MAHQVKFRGDDIVANSTFYDAPLLNNNGEDSM